VKPLFSKHKGPLIMDVIKERTPRDVVAAMRNGHYQGAMGFDWHLSMLEDKYKNVESIRFVVESTSKPILALNYNHAYDMSVYECPEEERIDLLLMAAEAGVTAVDIQSYTYDWSLRDEFKGEHVTDDMLFAQATPREIAIDPDIVEKQKTLIEKFHSMGTEVLMSCHTWVMMNSEQAVSLAKLIEKRNPDVIKIVIACETEEDLGEAIKTMVDLKKTIKTPIVYLSMGDAGKLTRIINPMLGSHLVFAINNFSFSSLFQQLHLKSAVDIFKHVDLLDV